MGGSQDSILTGRLRILLGGVICGAVSGGNEVEFSRPQKRPYSYQHRHQSLVLTQDASYPRQTFLASSVAEKAWKTPQSRKRVVAFARRAWDVTLAVTSPCEIRHALKKSQS